MTTSTDHERDHPDPRASATPPRLTAEDQGMRHPGANRQSGGLAHSQDIQPPPVILVPLFDGPAHASALPVARRLAHFQQASLHILLIADPATPTPTIVAQLGLGEEDLHDAVIERATGPIAHATLALAARWPGTAIVVALSATPEPTPEPTAAPGPVSAPEPTATPRPAPSRRPLTAGKPIIRPLRSEHPLGATLEEFITRAPGPLVLVPPREDWGEWYLRRILVPHDGTPTTGYAVGPALALAARAGAELVILHVTGPGASHPTEPGSMTMPRYIDQPQHEWPAWIREFSERLCAITSSGSVATRTLLGTGEPGHEIVRYTSELEIDLVVLGWHGSLEGSKATTLKEVIREAGAPTLILRTRS